MAISNCYADSSQYVPDLVIFEFNEYNVKYVTIQTSKQILLVVQVLTEMIFDLFNRCTGLIGTNYL